VKFCILLLPMLTIALALGSFPTQAAKAPPEIQEACSDDAQKLCPASDLLAAAGGSYTGVNACFHKYNAKLSPRCRIALSKNKLP
jgi:hypothetical protein